MEQEKEFTKILSDLPIFVKRLSESMAQLRLTKEGEDIANKIDVLMGNEDVDGLSKLLNDLQNGKI